MRKPRLEAATFDSDILKRIVSSLTDELARSKGLGAELVELRKRSPHANAVTLVYVGGAQEVYRLPSPAAELAKSASRGPDDKRPYELPYHIVAQPFDEQIEALRKQASDMVEAHALQHNISWRDAEAALGVISTTYRELMSKMNLVSRERFNAISTAQAKLHRTLAETVTAKRQVSADAEAMKRATEERRAIDRMTPSEAELHKRAATLATEKKISHGSAMGELMETSKEARELYRASERERFNRLQR